VEGVKFRIGPLTTYAAPGELRAWLGAARPGDQCTYALGPALDPGHETKRLAAEAAQRGEAHLFQKRDGRGWRYGIEKRVPAPRDDQRLRIATDLAGTPEGRLLRVLADLARAGVPLPSLSELADMADLADRFAAKYRLCRLRKAGLIDVRGHGHRREVEILGKGWITRSVGVPPR
jgi:hypothetical protein